MKWQDVKLLESEKLIDEFEKLCDYTFPKSFRDCVIQNNGGTPEKDIFDTETTQGRMMGFLFSFNKNDSSLSIWDVLETYESNVDGAKEYGDFEEAMAFETILNGYVVFADTPFGDEIAFDKTDDSVVFINHETLEVDKITNSFDEFLDCLYERGRND